MPITYTQEIFKIWAIKKVAINPSIMEGESFTNSLLGSNAALQIVRYAVTNVTLPSISGDAKIPNLLTCNPGVWAGSPQPFLTFQWYANGIAISGATQNTLMSTNDLADKVISCRVTATSVINTIFRDSSNTITLLLVLPIVMQHLTLFAIEGMSQENSQNIFTHDSFIISGISTETRLDVETKYVYIIEGLQASNVQTVFGIETYALELPRYDQDVTLVNSGAELNAMTGWTVVGNAPRISATYKQSGLYSFAGSITNSLLTAFYQDVAVPAGYETPIDNRFRFAAIEYYTGVIANNSNHTSKVYMEFFNSAMVSLGSNLVETVEMRAWSIDLWKPVVNSPFMIPVGTRTIRVHVNLISPTSTAINSAVDNILLKLYKTD